MAFGSTMILSQAATRNRRRLVRLRPPLAVRRLPGDRSGDRREVAYGERGQVVMNHISKGMFIPNNLEREPRSDSRARRAGRRFGSEVAPVATFGRGSHRRGVLDDRRSQWRCASLVAIDALGPDGAYRTRNREVIADTAGTGRRDQRRASAYVARTIGAQRSCGRCPPAPRGGAGEGRRDVRPSRSPGSTSTPTSS